jgi:hypothetical protein
MQIDKSLHELIEGVLIIVAQDMAGKSPSPRKAPVADPALWRAIQNQRKNGGSSYRAHLAQLDRE